MITDGNNLRVINNQNVRVIIPSNQTVLSILKVLMCQGCFICSL